MPARRLEDVEERSAPYLSISRGRSQVPSAPAAPVNTIGLSSLIGIALLSLSRCGPRQNLSADRPSPASRCGNHTPYKPLPP